MLLIVVLGACAAEDARSCEPRELQAALDAGRASQAVSGAAARLDSPACTWSGGAGLADRRAGRAVTPGERFRVGSVTKTFTAAVVLQLVDEGRLALDDRLSDHVAFPGGDAITVRHLLSHTSGIYNYTDSPLVRADSDRAWSVQEILEVAAAEPRAFAPGTAWDYSNTNYILLGLIIEQVTGQPYHREVRARLLEPLGLDDTFLEGAEPIPDGYARGYERRDGELVDITDEFHPSLAWAAGAMVSTVGDAAAWARALYAGDVLAPATRAEMLTPTALPGNATAPYGLGVFVEQTALGPIYGHGGTIHGFQARMAYLPDVDLALAAVVNDWHGDPEAILAALRDPAGL